MPSWQPSNTPVPLQWSCRGRVGGLAPVCTQSGASPPPSAPRRKGERHCGEGVGVIARGSTRAGMQSRARGGARVQKGPQRRRARRFGSRGSATVASWWYKARALRPPGSRRATPRALRATLSGGRGVTMRVLGLALTLAVCCTAELLPSFDDDDGVCAKIEAEQSTTWQEGHAVGWHFDIHIRFPLAEMEAEAMLEKTIRIEWENDLTIEHLEPQGAVTFVGGGHRFVLVKPQAQYVGHDYFSVKGIRRGGPPEDLLEPTITCTGDVDVPPPSPPHPPDCDLAPQVHTYPIGSSSADGSRVTMKLSSWKPWRVFTLTYFEQSSLLIKKAEGATLMVLPHRTGAEQMEFAFTLNDQPSSGEGCGGHPSCLEFEAHPGVRHPHPHVLCITTPPPSPPRLPLIHSPPPPVAVSPPPSPATLFARGTCYLGGQAVAMRSHSDDPTQQGVRVVVTFDRWDAGAVFTVLVNGRLLRSTNSWSADEVASGTPLSADFAFAFKLREAAPQAENAFAFRMEGQRFDRLVKLSCEAPQAEPTPTSPTTPTKTATQYAYDPISLYDNTNSYGIQTEDTTPTPVPQASTPTGSASEAGGGAGAAVGLFFGAVVVLAGGFFLWRRSTNRSLSIGGAVQSAIHGRPHRARAHPSEKMEFTAEDDVLSPAVLDLNPAAAAAAAALAESPQAMVDVDIQSAPHAPPARRPAI